MQEANDFSTNFSLLFRWPVILAVSGDIKVFHQYLDFLFFERDDVVFVAKYPDFHEVVSSSQIQKCT